MFPTVQALILAGQMARSAPLIDKLKQRAQLAPPAHPTARMLITPRVCAIPLKELHVDSKADAAMVKKAAPDVDPKILVSPPAPSCGRSAPKYTVK